MSILIPGFSIPPKGTVRTLVLFDDGMLIDNADGQNQWQAIELPPHGRLGDLDKLDYAFTALRFNGDGSLNHWEDRKNWCLHGSEIEMLLANAPTIIPADGGALMAEWIPVTERLPEQTPARCLCYCKDGCMVGTYTSWGWMFPCYMEKVTHWMPLPDPPEGGDAE